MEPFDYHFSGEEEIVSPQLVYYKEALRENLRRTIAMAGGPQRLWPHVKTHKMAQMVRMQVEAGITRFKCATIAEAEMCAANGASHVTLAYPCVGPNIPRFVQLCGAYPGVTFYAIGDDRRQVELLGAAAAKAGFAANILMDMDLGQHRTGVPMEKAEGEYVAWAALPGVAMRGMHCYDGHRHEEDLHQREAQVRPVDKELEQLKTRLTEAGLDCGILIMGGTPSFPCHAAMTEEFLSPGTCFVQDAGYDAAYPDLKFVPAAAVLTRVVSHPTADTFTVDLGTKAVASDPEPLRAVLADMPWAVPVMQNEEHWVLQVPPEHKKEIPPIGAVLYAVPWHVCPTSALYSEALVVEDGRLTGSWPVTARNRRINH